MSENEKSRDEWSRYQNLVLSELEKIDNWQEAVNTTLTEIKIEIATLKVKAAMWGSVAAIVLTALLNFGLASFTPKSPTINEDQLQRIEKILSAQEKEVSNNGR